MESITKKITFLEDDGNYGQSEYLTNGHRVSLTDISALNPPRENYRVTYTLDSEGDYEVQLEGRMPAVAFRLQTASGAWRYFWALVCWLPDEWDGKRVTRTVHYQEGETL